MARRSRNANNDLHPKNTLQIALYLRILPKMKNTSAICNDLIRCYWIKRTYSTHKPLVRQFDTIYEQTACQNITHKLSTQAFNEYPGNQNTAKFNQNSCQRTGARCQVTNESCCTRRLHVINSAHPKHEPSAISLDILPEYKARPLENAKIRFLTCFLQMI